MKEEKRKILVEKLLKGLGALVTLFGLYWAIFQELTDGLLLMILGELIDMPHRIRDKF